MNTVNNPVTYQSKQQRISYRRRLMLRRIITIGACVGIAFSAGYSHYKNLHTISTEVNQLQEQVRMLVEENECLNAELRESNRKLSLFVDDTEVRATEPTIYNVPISEELQRYTYSKCVDYGIPQHYELVLAMMWQESDFTADLVSTTDDYGIMQINKVNHDWLGESLGITDFLDEYQNIEAGVYLISKLLSKYDNESKALMAYNMGEAGAATNWAVGIYSSNYSASVLEKCKLIKADSYEA